MHPEWEGCIQPPAGLVKTGAVTGLGPRVTGKVSARWGRPSGGGLALAPAIAGLGIVAMRQLAQLHAQQGLH